MKLLIRILLNAVISFGVSLGVLYWAPGYAPNPQEMVLATNANTNAITKLANSMLEVIKRMNEIAPPSKKLPEHTGEK